VTSKIKPLSENKSKSTPERDFWLLLMAYLTSALGSTMIPVALSFTMLKIGRSTSEVGGVLAIQSFVYAALLLPAGAIADHLSRKNLIIASDILRCSCHLAIAFLLFMQETSIWALTALVALSGIGNAIFQPAIGGLLPQIVTKENIQKSTSMLSISYAASNMVGPSLAGIILATGISWLVFFLDAVTFAISAMLIYFIRSSVPKPNAKTRNIFNDMAAGWLEFKKRRWLWAITGLFCSLNLFAMPFLLVLGAALFYERGESAVVLGGLMTFGGIGVLIGGYFAFKVSIQYPLAFAAKYTTLAAPVLIFIAIDAPLPITLISSIFLGATLAYSSIVIQSIIQHEVSNDLVSRVLSISQLATLATAPFGFAMAGSVSGFLGAEMTLMISASVIIISSIITYGVKDIRQFTLAKNKEET